jgi:hypothetical protein
MKQKNNKFLLEDIHDTGTTILEIGEINSELKRGKFDDSILKDKPLFPINNQKGS